MAPTAQQPTGTDSSLATLNPYAVEGGGSGGLGAEGSTPAPESSGFPGTSPTPIPTTAPGAPDAAYNPLSAQPYTPPTANPVQAVPQAQPLGPDQQAPGAANHAGAASYLGDQILRGFMQGRAISQMKSAANLYKQSSGLQKNLDMASQQYYNLAKAGADPNSQQMQDAKSQVDAAWQANMDFMKQHVAGQQVDKKTGQIKPQQGNILERLMRQDDPAAQSLAVYQGAQALGPPVYHQAAPFLTPQYQAYAKTQAQTAGVTAQGQLSAAQLAATKDQQEQQYNTLLTKTDRTPEEDQQMDALGQALDKPGTLTSRVKDQMAQQVGYLVSTGQMTREDGIKQLAMLNSKGAGMFLKQPQLGTKGYLQQQYALANHIDPEHIPPADQIYLDSLESWAKIHPQTNSQQHLVPGVDAEGRAGMIPMTTYSTRGVPGAPQPPPGRKSIDDLGPIPTQEAGQAAANPVVPLGATPSAITAAATTHSNALANGASPTQALTAARVAARRAQKSTSDSEPPGFIPTGQPRKQTPDETKVYNEENEKGQALTAAEQAAQLPDKTAGDAALSTEFAHSLVNGRLSNFDIARFSNLGSARLKMEGSVMKSINGTMTDEQRNMILDYMRVQYNTVHNLAENYRKGQPGVGQKSSTAPSRSGAGAAPSADDLENLFQQAKTK